MEATLELPAETESWQARHRAPIPPQPVRHWVAQCIALCLPDRVYWCTGDSRERSMLQAQASREKRGVGLGRKWEGSPDEPAFKPDVRDQFRRCMLGRTMYVIPFAIDPLASARGNVAVQVTDSAQMALDLAGKTRVGDPLWKTLSAGESFRRRLHSMG